MPLTQTIEDMILRSRPLPAWMSAPGPDGTAELPREALPVAGTTAMSGVLPSAVAPDGVDAGRAPSFSGPAADAMLSRLSRRGGATAAPAPGSNPMPAVPPAPTVVPPVVPELAPVPTQDPFRTVAPPADPRFAGGRRIGPTPDGQELVTPEGMYRSPSGNWIFQDQLGPRAASMGPNGFTPGNVNVGFGRDMRVDTPEQYLMAVQQQAQEAGVNPLATLGALTQGWQTGGQHALQAGLAAQQGNTQLRLGALGSQTTQAEGAANRANALAIAQQQSMAAARAAGLQTLGQVAGAVAANPGANLGVLSQFGQMVGGLLPPLMPGGPAVPAPAGPAAPAGTPAAPTAAPAAGPGGPLAGVIAAGNDQQFVQTLRSAFGTVGPNGQFVPTEGGPTPAMATQLLDRLQGGNATDAQRAAVVAAIQRGDFGDPTAVQNAILAATAQAHFQHSGGQAVAPSALQPTRNFFAPFQQPPYAVMGSGGQPLFTYRVGPITVPGIAQSVLQTGGTPYNQVVGRNGAVIPVSPVDLLGMTAGGLGANRTPIETIRGRAGQGSSLLEALYGPRR